MCYLTDEKNKKPSMTAASKRLAARSDVKSMPSQVRERAKKKAKPL